VLLTVNARVLPTFTAVNPICDGEVLNALPLISNNSINGTWLPALDNTTTTTYTFTPDAGECALDNTLQIVVNPIITPTFNAVAAICNGDVLAALPLSSTNNIDGTWSPALDNTLTTTYTFTPDAGQCAVTSDLTIDVVDYQTPVITCGTSTVSSVTFDWTALVGASDYDISYSINNGAAINGGNQAGVSFTLNGLNPDDVVDLTLTTNGTDCYNIGTATCTASTCNSPIITAQPTSQTDCEGNQVNFTVSATGATAFQWQVSNNNGTTFFNVIDFPGNISGATTNALSITDNTGLDGLIYQVVISEVDNTCPTISNQVSLTVNPIPVINATNNGPLCEDANLNLNVNNVAGAVFSWTGPNYASGAQNNVIPLALIANSGDYTVTATANGCSASSTTTVTVSGETPINIVAAGPFCETDIPVVLVADVPGGIWTGSGIIDDAAGVFDPSQATIGANDITYTLLTGCGGQNTTTITVNAQANASFLLENNILDPINPQAEIINLSQNAVTYEWTFGDNTTSTDVEPIHLYSQEPRNYTINLIATSIDGCSDTTSIIVTVPETLIFYVPNSFTPNGDELNNTFLPIFTSGFDPFDYRLSIYNRWGELIFESLDHTVGWDGTFKNLGISEQGTYTFKIEFALKSTGDKETSVGSFSLFR
jgi:gliding motility-associated-like protein